MGRLITNKSAHFGPLVFKQNLDHLGAKCDGDKGYVHVMFPSKEYITQCLTRPEYNRRINLLSLNFKKGTLEISFKVFFVVSLKKIEVQLRRSTHPASDAESYQYDMWVDPDKEITSYITPPKESWMKWMKGNEWLENFVDKYDVRTLEGTLMNLLRYNQDTTKFNEKTLYPEVDTLIDNIKSVF